MKNALILASILLSSSAFAHDAQVSFSGSCEEGTFDAAGQDIEYSNLGLDLLEGKTSAECVITTTLPGKHGLRINISEFKVEAEAFDVQEGGIALLTVGHRFNGQTQPVYRAQTRVDGPLVSAQQAIGVSECGQPVVIRTKLAAKAVKASLLQDSATSNSVSYKIGYTVCH